MLPLSWLHGIVLLAWVEFTNALIVSSRGSSVMVHARCTKNETAVGYANTDTGWQNSARRRHRFLSRRLLSRTATRLGIRLQGVITTGRALAFLRGYLCLCLCSAFSERNAAFTRLFLTGGLAVIVFLVALTVLAMTLMKKAEEGARESPRLK